MPRVRPLLPTERMRDKFYIKLENRANEIGLRHDKDIAERLGLKPANYCHRKKQKDLSGWSVDEFAAVVKKFRLTGDDVMEILAEGTRI